MPKITPFLWFDTEAEEAASSTPLSSRALASCVCRYGEAGPGTPGSVMTVEFGWTGTRFVALNGGPEFASPRPCRSRSPARHRMRSTTTGASSPTTARTARAAGSDRFGLSWQVVPSALPRLLSDPDREKAQRVMACMLQMSKLEIAELEAAAAAA